MERKTVQKDVNRSTILPLPLKIPAQWYDLLPKVLPLIRETSEEIKYCIRAEAIQSFTQMWSDVFLAREGNFVWLRLGGAACTDTIPRFLTSVEFKIKSRDAEIKKKGGLPALAEHWRESIKELQYLDDKAVLRFRDETLHLLFPKMWYEALNGAWHLSLEKTEEKDETLAKICQWLANRGE